MKFKVGKVYECRSVCDYNTKWGYEVVRRTEKSVWLREVGGESVKRFAVKFCESYNMENVWPLGRYSMAPILSSN